MKEISIGEAIKQRRLDLGLSQERLCEGICDTTTLSRLENGKYPPAHNRVKALLQRLGMPDDRYYALLNAQELELSTVRKELRACYIQFTEAKSGQKRQARELAIAQLRRLEELAEEDDHITRQCILGYKATLGSENGPYSPKEQLDIFLQALRLTVPRFDLDKIENRRYTMEETELIVQITVTHSKAGDHSKALELYEQIFQYVRKNDDRLSIYASHFTLIAHNYALELGRSSYYTRAIEIAEQGRQVSLKYGEYHFLPGFFAIMGECYYHLGQLEKSKKLCVHAHYLYEALGDERNLARIDPDIKERFHFEFPV